MNTNEILERLTQLHKTVKVVIFGGDGYCYPFNENHWKVELETKDEEIKVQVECQGFSFEETLKKAWTKFETALTLGAAPHALVPPVEHEQLEHKPKMNDEIPF